MEIHYKHEITRSFLVIQPDGEVDTKAYPLRMVLSNSIPGLLPCKLQKADGKVWFYYDVTARQQMSDSCQKLTYKQLRKIYQGLLKIFEQMDEYLLDANQLLLDVQYIYLDEKIGNLYLCYLPGYEKPIREQLRHFTEYLLPLVDHRDSRGVTLSYGVYRLLAEKGFQTEAVGEILRRAEAQENVDAQGVEDMPEESEPFASFQRDRKERTGKSDKEEEKPLQKRMGTKQMLLFPAGFVLLAGFLIFRRMGYLLGITFPVMLAILFGGILAAAWIVQKKKRKPLEEPLCKSPQYQGPALVCEEMEQVPPILLSQETVAIEEVDETGQSGARIQRKEEGYWITRLLSEEEIFLNGRKLEIEEEYLLHPEDRIVFAGRCYRFTES